MKKILLLLSVFVMASCSKEEPIETPTDGASQIETNNEIIESYEEHLVDAQEKYEMLNYLIPRMYMKKVLETGKCV